MFTTKDYAKGDILFDLLEEYRASRGLRNTPERKEVLNAVLKIEGEFSALEVCAYASDDINQSTVYNCLKLFVEAGIIEEVSRIGKEMKYRVKDYE